MLSIIASDENPVYACAMPAATVPTPPTRPIQPSQLGKRRPKRIETAKQEIVRPKSKLRRPARPLSISRPARLHRRRERDECQPQEGDAEELLQMARHPDAIGGVLGERRRNIVRIGAHRMEESGDEERRGADEGRDGADPCEMSSRAHD